MQEVDEAQPWRGPRAGYERVTTRIRSHTSSEVAVAATVQVAAQIAHHIHGVEAGEPASERRPRHRGGLGGAPETRQHQRGVLARTDHEGAQRGLQRLGAAARHELQQMTPGGPGAAAQPRRDVPARTGRRPPRPRAVAIARRSPDCWW